MAETSLKPCPFCGKAMQYRAALFVSDGCTDAVIHAEPTDCGLVQFDIGATDGGVSTIAAWNRRATDPAVAELVEALNAILTDMPIIDCDRLHHTKEDRHGAGPCPVEMRLDAAVSRASALLAKYAASPRDAT